MDARLSYLLRLLEASGHRLGGGFKVLDFGCGNGAMVEALMGRGFDAWGCDFAEELPASNARLLALTPAPYRIPFDDDSFDTVLSDQVFEHVQDYHAAFTEIRRVLSPRGVSLHVFPPRFVFREPHSFVPLASVIQRPWWLRLWARLGVRNQFQQGKTAAEVSEINLAFLSSQTTYYPRRQVLREARRVFPGARLLGPEILASKSHPAARTLAAGSRYLPFISTAFSETRERALILE